MRQPADTQRQPSAPSAELSTQTHTTSLTEDEISAAKLRRTNQMKPDVNNKREAMSQAQQ
jgi:hypothetical protein